MSDDISQDQSSKKGCFNGCVLIFIVLLLFFVFFRGCGSSDDWTKKDEDFAYYSAKEVIKDKLKSPSSAKFSNIKIAFTEEKNEYSIIGNVDSKNSFGVSLRTQFRVDIVRTGENDYRVIASIIY